MIVVEGGTLTAPTAKGLETGAKYLSNESDRVPVVLPSRGRLWAVTCGVAMANWAYETQVYKLACSHGRVRNLASSHRLTMCHNVDIPCRGLLSISNCASAAAASRTAIAILKPEPGAFDDCGPTEHECSATAAVVLNKLTVLGLRHAFGPCTYKLRAGNLHVALPRVTAHLTKSGTSVAGVFASKRALSSLHCRGIALSTAVSTSTSER